MQQKRKKQEVEQQQEIDLCVFLHMYVCVCTGMFAVHRYVFSPASAHQSRTITLIRFNSVYSVLDKYPDDLRCLFLDSEPNPNRGEATPKFPRIEPKVSVLRTTILFYS